MYSEGNQFQLPLNYLLAAAHSFGFFIPLATFRGVLLLGRRGGLREYRIGLKDTLIKKHYERLGLLMINLHITKLILLERYDRW